MRIIFRYSVVLLLIALGGTAGISVASAQDWKAELEFESRQHQLYQLKFAARPDATRFQLRRVPSRKWPKRENFYVKVGETTGDGQIRVDSFEEREAKNAKGAIVDASEIKITYLKDGTKHTIVRDEEYVIPTYFAGLIDLSDPGRTFYVKEGDEFVIKKYPAIQFRLGKVNENKAVIHVLKEGRKISEFEIGKK